VWVGGVKSRQISWLARTPNRCIFEDLIRVAHIWIQISVVFFLMARLTSKEQLSCNFYPVYLWKLEIRYTSLTIETYVNSGMTDTTYRIYYGENYDCSQSSFLFNVYQQLWRPKMHVHRHSNSDWHLPQCGRVPAAFTTLFLQW